MKLKTRFASATALFSVAALALTGCAGGGATSADDGPIDTSGELSGTVKFQTWSLKNEKFTPYFESLVASFEKENPKVTVEWLDQPGDGYQDKVLSQASANSLPDVVNLPPDIAYPLVSAGKLVDLSIADAALEKEYVPGAWEAYTFPGDDGAYGLPWYLGSDLNWWNTAELGKYGVDVSTPPATIDELFALADEVAVASNGTMPVISAMPTIDEFNSAGFTITNDDGEFVFNSDEAAAFVDKYTAAYQAGAMPGEALNGDYGGGADLFKQNKVAFATAGFGLGGDLLRDAPSIHDNVVVSPRIGDPALLVQGVSVSTDSTNKPAALAFARYLTNTENQLAFVELALGFMPGTIEGSADIDSLTSTVTDPLQMQAMDVISEEMTTARALTPYQWTSAMKTYLDQQLGLALKGDISSQEALDKAVVYANDNLILN